MADYKRPQITDAVIQRAAQDAKYHGELMALFEQCERDNIVEYNRRADAHTAIMRSIKGAGFYPDKVLKYMKQQWPAQPVALGRQKKQTRAKIEAAQQRLEESRKRSDYRERWKVKTEAAITTLTEHGYVEGEDFLPYRAISFLKSVTDYVETPEGSGIFDKVIRAKVVQGEGDS